MKYFTDVSAERRLVFHGQTMVVRVSLVEEGGAMVEIFNRGGCAQSASVVFDAAEVSQVLALLRRGQRKRKAARP